MCFRRGKNGPGKPAETPSVQWARLGSTGAKRRTRTRPKPRGRPSLRRPRPNRGQPSGSVSVGNPLRQDSDARGQVNQQTRRRRMGLAAPQSSPRLLVHPWFDHQLLGWRPFKHPTPPTTNTAVHTALGRNQAWRVRLCSRMVGGSQVLYSDLASPGVIHLGVSLWPIRRQFIDLFFWDGRGRHMAVGRARRPPPPGGRRGPLREPSHLLTSHHRPFIVLPRTFTRRVVPASLGPFNVLPRTQNPE